MVVVLLTSQAAKVKRENMPNPQQKKGLFQFYPHNLWWIGLAILAIILDQWTKWIAVTHLEYADPVPVLPFLNWTLSVSYTHLTLPTKA